VKNAHNAALEKRPRGLASICVNIAGRNVGLAMIDGSVSERKLMPRLLKSSIIAIRSRKPRARRSSFQTMSVSPSRSVLRQWRRKGALWVALVASSSKSL